MIWKPEIFQERNWVNPENIKQKITVVWICNIRLQHHPESVKYIDWPEISEVSVLCLIGYFGPNQLIIMALISHMAHGYRASVLNHYTHKRL